MSSEEKAAKAGRAWARGLVEQVESLDSLPEEEIIATLQKWEGNIASLLPLFDEEALAEALLKQKTEAYCRAWENSYYEDKEKEDALLKASGLPCGNSFIDPNKKCRKTGMRARAPRRGGRKETRLGKLDNYNKLKRGFVVKDAKGKKITFGKRVLGKLNERNPRQLKDRLEHLNFFEQTVKKGTQMKVDGFEDRVLYSMPRKEGSRDGYVVLVDKKTNEVFNFYIKSNAYGK